MKLKKKLYYFFAYHLLKGAKFEKLVKNTNGLYYAKKTSLMRKYKDLMDIEEKNTNKFFSNNKNSIH